MIGTKWVYKNKLNEKGEVVRNKARLIAQGYSQQEGIEYTETLAPVARLESTCLLILFAVNHNIILYHMDVKSAFLNGYIFEEVYVHQPPGFESSQNLYFVFKLKKSLYGLKQALRAWYDRVYDTVQIIDYCGEFPNVPLLGTCGGINYKPILEHCLFIHI